MFLPIRILALLFFFSLSGFSRHLNPDWKEGNVILETEGYFSGPLFVDCKNDVLLLKKGSQIKAYPAHKVKKFQFYDEELLINRDFITYKISESRGIPKAVFLEIVLTGEVKIYRKEKKTSSALSNDVFEKKEKELSIEHGYIYYAAIGDQLIELNKFRKKILPLMNKSTDGKLLAFIKDNSLKAHVLSHQVILVDYYNALQDPFYKGLKHNLTARN